MPELREGVAPGNRVPAHIICEFSEFVCVVCMVWSVEEEDSGGEW